MTYEDDEEDVNLTATQRMERIACERSGFIFSMYVAGLREHVASCSLSHASHTN